MMYSDLLGSKKYSEHSFSCSTMFSLITLSLNKLNPAIIPPQNCKYFNCIENCCRAVLNRYYDISLPWRYRCVALSILQQLDPVYVPVKVVPYLVEMLFYEPCRESLNYLCSISSILFLCNHVLPERKDKSANIYENKPNVCLCTFSIN